MCAFTLIAVVPFALSQHYVLNLDCTNYLGSYNNDCYTAYVANKLLVWRNYLPQEEISALTSVLRDLTTMGPTARPLTHTGERLVVSPLPHVAMAKWQR